MTRILFLPIVVLLLLASKCAEVEPPDTVIFKSQDFKFNYSIDNPLASIFLNYDLKEISGIECSLDDKYLYAVNDEKAELFVLNISTGEVIEKINFGKPDDYEGLCMVNNLVYIAESNGNLKAVNPITKKRVATYDCRLSRKNDIEGLAYDISTKSLLLAAKGHSKLDGHKKGKRSIFKIPISDFKVEKKPFLTIDLEKSIKSLIPNVNIDTETVGILNKRVKEFAPSGLAIHPLTKDLYMLSARGKILIVLTPDGNLQAVVFLNKNENQQPEGICFKKDGTMFISNEGASGNGKLAIFSMAR